MEKQNKFKLKIPSFITSSCKTQNLSEVIDHHKNPIFLQPSLMEQVQNEEENEPFHTLIIKPKQTPSSISSSSSSSYNASSTSSSMMCKPRCPETFDHMVRENCIIAGNNFPRRKFAGKYSMLSPSGDFSGRRCPPASPATPMFQQQGKKKNKKKKVQEKRHLIRSKNNNVMKTIGFNPNPFSFSSSNETDNGDLFSSDDEREEDEKQNMFSLKSVSFSSKSLSLSSDSDTSYPIQTQTRTQTQARPRPRRLKPGSSRPRREVGIVPLEGKVKDTFAVVKSSSDPYNDFRTSMVEMIIEKQIFGAEELEQLLKCFLSLNSLHHHRVIVEVFTEICDALFSHFS